MMAYVVAGILIIAIILFITEKLPLAVTAMCTLMAFYLVGAIDAKTTLAAFSNSTSAIIVSMAIIGETVFKTGGAAMMGRVLKKAARGSERMLVFATVMLSGLMSAFFSNTGAAALLIALILGICSSTGMSRSKLIYPVAVGCTFGGGITIIGNTSSPFLKETLEGLGTGQTFSFFEWAPLSIILLIISGLFLATIGFKAMPAKPNNERTYKVGNADDSEENVIPWKKWAGLAILTCTIIGMIFEKKIGIPLHLIGVMGAVLAITLGLITVDEATGAIPVTGWVLYAALLPIAKAMTASGLADKIAQFSLHVLGNINSPLVIILLIFLIVTPLTQFMSNAATMFLFVPIALVIADTLKLNPKAILTIVRFAATIAIATPIGMPCSAMTVEPGGYSFMDFIKMGLPLTIILIVITIVYVYAFYPIV